MLNGCMAKSYASKSYASSDQPPIDDSYPGGDETDGMELSAPNLTLSPDMLAGAGLDNLMEGDTFTVTITGRVTSADGDLMAEITGAMGGKMGEGDMQEPMDEMMEEPMGDEMEDEMDDTGMMAPGVKGPKEAGFAFRKSDRMA